MNIFIVGASGRMGGELRELIGADPNLKFVGGLAEKVSAGNIGTSFEGTTDKIDVVIDFSNASLFPEVLRWCMQRKFPLLSGTTGISAGDKSKINSAGNSIPILWTPNTSPGIHWVKKIFSTLNPPPGFEIQITEAHHASKVDKPSGTALLLQAAVEKKQKTVSPPVSIREGDIFGIHVIELKAADEIVTIKHEALSRTLFARGALNAAQWLAKQKPGVYSMEDYI